MHKTVTVVISSKDNLDNQRQKATGREKQLQDELIMQRLRKHLKGAPRAG